MLGHCRCVAGLAAALCDQAQRQGLAVDRDRVVAAALLHDLGRSVTQDVRHASVGADLLRQDAQGGHGGWDERVVLMVERHTGAGIDAQEAARLGLPVRDYTPRTLEEKIVAHADNLHSGERRLRLDEVRAKYEAKGLAAAGAKIAALHQELTKTLGVDLERVDAASVDLE